MKIFITVISDNNSYYTNINHSKYNNFMKSTIIKLTKITVAKTIKVNAINTRDIYDYITFNDGCNCHIAEDVYEKLVESGYVLRNRTHVIRFDTIATRGAFSVDEDGKTITFMNY